MRLGILIVLATLVTGASLVAQDNTGAPLVSEVPPLPPPKLPEVTSQDLVSGLTNPTRWLTYSGDYSGRRHSPLKQITPDNVSRLTAQWTFQAEGMGRIIGGRTTCPSRRAVRRG